MYYLRFKKVEHGKTLQLLYRPSPSLTAQQEREEANTALRYLIDLIGQERGAFWWFEPESCSLRSQKISQIVECHVYQYDGEAPYDGLYVHRDSVRALMNEEE